MKPLLIFFKNTMGFEEGRFYTSVKISKMVRKVFGTRYYNRIVYALHPMDNGTVKLVVDAVENPTTFAKLGLHYNNFTGISLIGNVTSRNLFFRNSRSLVTVNLGENFHARAEHLQYLGRGKNIVIILVTQYDNLDITTYSSYRKDGLYGMQVFKADGRVEFSASRKFTIGIGTRFEWIKYKPSIQSVFEIRE